ncbi:MAG: hypothetical protein HDT16_00070 [Oscillibacter sp.]|nr:hypothetical protein [Oscillibacter sp.]
MNNERSSFPDHLLSALENDLGEIISVCELNPGVYYIEVRWNDAPKDYYVVLDTAPMAEKVRSYGKKMDGLRLFAYLDDSSGWRIVEYEVERYDRASGQSSVPECIFRDMALHAMEVHPEYFGTFPAPYYTPSGYTLRYRTLDNGIYWVETSSAEELLAVCSPIWNAELSAAAIALSKAAEWDRIVGIEETMGYVFFPKESSAVPIYELMETRRKWDGTVICRPALMNALWQYAPEYTMRLNRVKNQALNAGIAQFLGQAGAIPQPEGRGIVGMFPDAGTDFLLLK